VQSDDRDVGGEKGAGLRRGLCASNARVAVRLRTTWLRIGPSRCSQALVGVGVACWNHAIAERAGCLDDPRFSLSLGALPLEPSGASHGGAWRASR
jgi:hypothetical protein